MERAIHLFKALHTPYGEITPELLQRELTEVWCATRWAAALRNPPQPSAVGASGLQQEHFFVFFFHV